MADLDTMQLERLERLIVAGFASINERFDSIDERLEDIEDRIDREAKNSAKRFKDLEHFIHHEVQ